MYALSLQDQRAWRYYMTKMGSLAAATWAQVSDLDKTWARIQATREMLNELAPHKH